MLRHFLKTGDLTSRSERNAALTRTFYLLSEAFRDSHKEYTNLLVVKPRDLTYYVTCWTVCGNSRF